MKRVFWAMVGVGIGAAVGIAAVRWAGRTKRKLSPPSLARGAGERGSAFADRLRGAIDAGREAMVEREAELRAELKLDQ